MIRDIRRYWEEVRIIEGRLPEFVWLAAEGSAPVQTPAAIAARLLFAKSHRLATDAEVLAQGASDQAANREVRRGQMKRRGVAVVGVATERVVS